MNIDALATRLLSVCLVLLLAACGANEEPAPATGPKTVGVLVAQTVNVPLARDVVGRLSAFRSADVHARVAGVLLKRAYVEGSEVRKGQLLFEIDPDPLKAALAASAAQLAKDEALLAQAQANLERYERLFREKAVAEQTLLDQKFLVQQQQAAVRLDQANVETARIQLGYASVTAPIAGRAGQQQVTEGALVGQGAPTLLTTVSQLDPLYVNFTMSASDLSELRAAAQRGAIRLNDTRRTAVRVTLPDGTPYPQTGLLDFSAPTVDPATGSVSLRAVLPNPGSILLPGAYVRLQLLLGERHDAFLLPAAAVQRDITGTYVLLVDGDDTVVHRNVSTPGMHGADWIVTGGLEAGDRVIVSGLQSVQVGEKATVTPWQRPAVDVDAAPMEETVVDADIDVGVDADVGTNGNVNASANGASAGRSSAGKAPAGPRLDAAAGTDVGAADTRR